MALIIAFVVVVAITPVVAVVARRLRLVDRPGPLKVHDAPVPYLGGAAVLVGLVLPIASERCTLLLPLVLAFALGLADDRFELKPPSRLACEVLIGVAAAIVVPSRGPVGALATIAAVVVLLNAVNLLDGLDGLTSSVGAVSALGFAALLSGGYRAVGLAVAGALAGFLVWNRPPARIYLGDAGSYLVGTALALLLSASFRTGDDLALASGAMLLVVVPVADTAVAIVRRLRAGQPLFHGDRGHVYDQLVDRGLTPTATVAVCVGAQALFSVGGVGVSSLPASPALATTAAVIAAFSVALFRWFTSPSSWRRA